MAYHSYDIDAVKALALTLTKNDINLHKSGHEMLINKDIWYVKIRLNKTINIVGFSEGECSKSKNHYSNT